MKKIFTGFAIALATFSFTATNAQTLLGGLKAGVNFSTIKGLNDNSDSQINPTGGIFFQYGVKPHVKFNMEFLYSPKSTAYTINEMDSATNTSKVLDYQVDFDYIDVPILISYNFFGDSAKFRPRIYAGPSFGIRYNAKSELTYKYSQNDSIVSEGVQTSETIAYNYSPVDVAVAVGGGATYAISSKLYALIDLRYIMSVTDLSENVTNKTAVKNSTFAAYIGVAYRLGGK